MKRRVWLSLIGLCAFMLALSGGSAGSTSAQAPTGADSDRVALFGTVVSVGDDSLVMETFNPLTVSEGTATPASESAAATVADGMTLNVTLEPGAVIEVTDDDLASLVPGTPILVGGALSGNHLAALFVADLRLAQLHELTEAEKAQLEASTGQEVAPGERPQPAEGAPEDGRTPSPEAAPEIPAAAFDGDVSGVEARDFHGGFGGPTDERIYPLDLYVLGIPEVLDLRLKEVGYRWSLDGYDYNFPFSFQARALQELVPGQVGTVGVRVWPEYPAGSSFYGGLGFTIWASVAVHVILVGDFDYTYTYGLGLQNSTGGKAPMLGETLSVAADVCVPTVTFGIPYTGLDVFSIEVCNDLLFTGRDFFADVSSSNGTVTSPANDRQFHGPTSWVDISVIPTMNPLNLAVDDLLYEPWLDYGLFARFVALGYFTWDAPTVWLVGDLLPIIPPGVTDCAWYETLWTTCGDPGNPQPTSVPLSLRVDEPPTVTLNGPTSVDEGDTRTYTFVASDPDGDDVSFVPGYPNCGVNGTLVGTPLIGDGEFQCHYVEGPNSTTVAIRVQDEHGLPSDLVTLAVTINNVPPDVSIDSITDQYGQEVGTDVVYVPVGFDVNLSATFDDVGVLDTHPSATIDWDDGTVYTEADFNTFTDCVGGAIGTVTATHIFYDTGTFTVELAVVDDDGGVGTATVDIQVIDGAARLTMVIDDLRILADDLGLDPDARAALRYALAELKAARTMLWWGQPRVAVALIADAVAFLERAESSDATLDLTFYKIQLAAVCKSEAMVGIAEATAAASRYHDWQKIAYAEQLVAEGDVLVAAGDYLGAIGKYHQAVRKVGGPLGSFDGVWSGSLSTPASGGGSEDGSAQQPVPDSPSPGSASGSRGERGR